MRNRLISAFIVVVVFWWIVLSAVSLEEQVTAFLFDEEVIQTNNPDGANWVALASRNLLLTAMGVVWGFLLVAAWIFYQKVTAKFWLSGSEKRGLTVSLGPFPLGRAAPSRVKLKEAKKVVYDPVVSAWISSHREKFPHHVALMETMIEIHQAHLEWPASHEGSHGKTSLFEHSQNVTRQMLRIAADNYSFSGVRGSSGVLIPLEDAHFVFDNADPMIPIIGMAHDLGKIDCFKRNGDGWISSSRDHAQGGARMLCSVDEVFKLPSEDISLLMNVVDNYHNPRTGKVQMSLTAGDRGRAFIDLLVTADRAASIDERRPSDAELYDLVDAEAGEVNTKSAGASGYQLTEHELRVFEAFEMLIQEPKRINGNVKELRLGFKHGNLLYLQERAVWEVLANKVLGDRMFDSITGRNQHSLTVVLQRALYKKGLLYHKHQGAEFSYKNAVFNIRFFDPKSGREIQRWSCALIVDATAFTALKDLPNSKNPPSEIHPHFGWGSAVNIRREVVGGELDLGTLSTEQARALSAGEADRILKSTSDSVTAIQNGLTQFAALGEDISSAFLPDISTDDDLDVPVDSLDMSAIPDFTGAQIGQLVLGRVLGRDGKLVEMTPGYQVPKAAEGVAVQVEPAATVPTPVPTQPAARTPEQPIRPAMPAPPVVVETLESDNGVNDLDDGAYRVTLRDAHKAAPIEADATQLLKDFDALPAEGRSQMQPATPAPARPKVLMPPPHAPVVVTSEQAAAKRHADEQESARIEAERQARIERERIAREQEAITSVERPKNPKKKPYGPKKVERPLGPVLMDVDETHDYLTQLISMGAVPYLTKEFGGQPYCIFGLAQLKESAASMYEWDRIADVVESSNRTDIIVRVGQQTGRAICVIHQRRKK